jgi:hypothetical protein
MKERYARKICRNIIQETNLRKKGIEKGVLS